MSTLREALAELVALDDLRAEFMRLKQRRAVAFGKDAAAVAECARMKVDYDRRKPLAWAAARATLVQPDAPLKRLTEISEDLGLYDLPADPIVSKTVAETTPVNVESLPVKVQVNPNANKEKILVAQPDEKPVEAWHGDRKVTVYADTVLRSWGPNIETQMSTAPRTAQEVQDAFVWLYTDDKAQPVAWLHESGVLRPDKDMEPLRKDLDSWTPLYAAPQPPAEHVCNIDEFSSRICERGTQSCITLHTKPAEHEKTCATRLDQAWAGPCDCRLSEQGAELSDEQIKEGGALLEYAAEWINSAPHGDNCFVSDHYEGDPGDRCNCGKDSLLAAIEAYLAARGGAA